MFEDDHNYKIANKKPSVKSGYKDAGQNYPAYPGAGNFGKSSKTVEQSSYKQAEVPVAKGKAQNDWDDDL